MPPRYSVRTQAADHRHYTVWDNETNRAATSRDGREHIDLRLEDAFKVTDDLNKQE